MRVTKKKPMEYSAMAMKKICPNCQHENPVIAPVCSYCNALLPEVPTEIVDIGSTPPHLKQLNQIASQRIETPPNSLSLLIPPEKSPLIKNFQDGDELILGRATTETSTPTIDLTPFGAASLGVSREHAAIKFSGAECSIVDLGSSNGTWLNENPLEAHKTHKLRNGDLLRLGNMLVFTYFSSRPESMEVIILGEKTQHFTADAQYRLTPSYLAEKITPFVNSIFEIQSQINHLLGNQSAGPEVDSISVSDKQPGIEVRLRGAAETVDFLNTKLYGKSRQEQEQHEAPVTTLIKEDIVLSSDSPSTAAGNDASPHLPAGWAQFCHALLVDVAPDVPAEIRASYHEKILPHLGIIAESNLEALGTGN